ncbi:MAG: FadR family transcriptional regulator [Desulfobacteraceae bacterium]|nr:FadR family transcriptional regulator [Desulfobacteraceae bacterium]
MERLFKKIPQKKVSDKVFEQIKTHIITGKFLPGEKIPPEMELTSLFNVSRSSVREAILKLECLGFVEQKRGDGTFVKSVTQAPIQDYMEEMTGEKDFLAGLMEVRIVLETWAAATAASRATDEDIEALKEILDEMENHKTEKMGYELNVKLHSRITSATRNPFLIHMMGSILQWLSTITQKVYADRKKYPERKQELTRQHSRIVKAIADRNPGEASAAMADHLNYTLRKATKNNDHL